MTDREEKRLERLGTGVLTIQDYLDWRRERSDRPMVIKGRQLGD